MTAIFADKNLSARLEIAINVCFAGAVVACRWGSYHRQDSRQLAATFNLVLCLRLGEKFS